MLVIFLLYGFTDQAKTCYNPKKAIQLKNKIDENLFKAVMIYSENSHLRIPYAAFCALQEEDKFDLHDQIRQLKIELVLARKNKITYICNKDLNDFINFLDANRENCFTAIENGYNNTIVQSSFHCYCSFKNNSSENPWNINGIHNKQTPHNFYKTCIQLIKTNQKSAIPTPIADEILSYKKHKGPKSLKNEANTIEYLMLLYDEQHEILENNANIK